MTTEQSAQKVSAARKPLALAGFLVWLGAVLVFAAAVIVGSVIDAAREPSPHPVYFGAVLMLPFAASALYFPMLIVSGAISVGALWVGNRRGMAAVTVVLDLVCSVPAGWVFFGLVRTGLF
jgi:hypothetical protein